MFSVINNFFHFAESALLSVPILGSSSNTFADY